MTSYRPIRLLPMHVANKIAAGEVVERPASALKELVENAFDAGATQIDIEAVAGGRKLVAVTDNGSGMNRDDALLSIEQHATSKIRDVDDIEKIATLGFRGEALAAIASASRLTLKTRAEGDETGTELRVVGGTLRDVLDIGFPRGTQVEVRDLFFNIPARRSFLRSAETEAAHLRACFVTAALSRPEVGMSLRMDDQDAYRLPAQAGLDDRIRDLFGVETARFLKAVSHRRGDVAVSGYVGIPRLSRADRSGQHIFVNGRPTSAAVIGHAVREGYHTLLPRDRHPLLFVRIEVPADSVDVNVHPTKREVRFRAPGDVRDAVTEALRAALRVGEPAESAGAAAPELRLEVQAPPAASPRQLEIPNLPSARPFSYPGLPPAPDMGFGGRSLPNADPAPEPTPHRAETQPALKSGGVAAASASAGALPSDAPWQWCRVVGQVGGLYVLLETDDGLVIMDPHAAHERALFEKFMREALNGLVVSQNLLMPETANLAPRDAVQVRKHLDALQRLGFGISAFGDDTFVVDSLPVCFGGVSASALLPEIAQSLAVRSARGAQERWREDAIAQAACKAAVKSRDRLTIEEIERLVIDLAVCDMPYTCPHGRPTLLFHSFQELGRKFARD